MSVVETVWLPNQPTVGLTHVQPLAGDGLHAPMSSVYCQATSAGDASGGTNQIEFRFDDQHLAMPHWACVSLSGISADASCLVDFRFGFAGATMRFVQHLALSFNTVSNDGHGVWRPPPIIAPAKPGAGSGAAITPFVEFVVDNATGDDLVVDLMAFEFSTTAAQRTPWPYLVSNFPS